MFLLTLTLPELIIFLNLFLHITLFICQKIATAPMKSLTVLNHHHFMKVANEEIVARFLLETLRMKEFCASDRVKVKCV